MKIAIIGSGIAGICVARALASLAKNINSNKTNAQEINRFHDIENITIFEKASSLDEALGTSPSGNPVGIIHPIISKHDFSRKWTDKGILTTLRWIKELKIESKHYSFCGVLHLPRNKKQSKDWQSWKNYQNLGSSFLSKNNLNKLFDHIRSETGAVWSSHCGWLEPKEFIKAALKEAEENLDGKLKIVFNSEINLKQLKTSYMRRSALQLKYFDSVIITAGFGSPILLTNNTLLDGGFGNKLKKRNEDSEHFSNNKPILELVSGQLTAIPASKKNCVEGLNYKSVLCKSGYVTPIINGYIYSGASYETVNKPHKIATEKNRVANIKRLTNLIPEINLSSDFGNKKIFDRVSARCVSKDRLPLIGLIEKENPKVYALTALGSRGLSWAPLAAEHLANEILSTAFPKSETTIDKNILPNRFEVDK